MSQTSMTERRSLFEIAQEFQLAVGASKDLEIIFRLFKTVLLSANSLPEPSPAPTKTKEKKPKLSKAERKKLREDAEFHERFTHHIRVMRLYENAQLSHQPPTYSSCQE